MKPTSGRSSSSASWWTDRRPIPARAGTGPSGTPRVTRRVIGRYIAFGATTLPPIFSHSPFGTYFHSFGSLLVFAWPAQECAGLAQSFLPASATPAHLSLAAASSADAVALPNASRLPMAEAMAMVFRFMRLLRSCLWIQCSTGLSDPAATAIISRRLLPEAHVPRPRPGGQPVPESRQAVGPSHEPKVPFLRRVVMLSATDVPTPTRGQ